jgi:hypothetical protein
MAIFIRNIVLDCDIDRQKSFHDFCQSASGEIIIQGIFNQYLLFQADGDVLESYIFLLACVKSCLEAPVEESGQLISHPSGECELSVWHQKDEKIIVEKYGPGTDFVRAEMLFKGWGSNARTELQLLRERMLSLSPSLSQNFFYLKYFSRCDVALDQVVQITG